MDTQKLMDIALEAAGLSKMPADCAIIVEGTAVKKVLMGVDMDTAELMLAKELGYDCVVSHHPRNTDAQMLDVLNDHIYKLQALGVPVNKSQKLLAERKEELRHKWHSANSRRSESAAKLLNMPFLCIHTPTDLIGQAVVQNFLDERFAANAQATLGEVIDCLDGIPEYRDSVRKPLICAGSRESYVGKILVMMSGLTGPGPKITREYFEAGVGTLIKMHVSEEDAKAVAEQGIGNIVAAGHMSSDSIGLNRLAQKWAELGVETTVMSGIVANNSR